MSHLEPERIALIAIGEAPTDAEQSHLDVCDECALELAELEHTVAIGRSTASLGDVEAPPERVWERIVAEVRAAPPDVAEAPATEVEAAAAAPIDGGSRRDRRRRAGRRRSPLMFALAASVAVMLAIVGVWTFVRPAQVVELASATLQAFPDHPGAAGSAVVVELRDGEREVEVRLDASAADGGYREVWLINADATALVSLGVLEGTEGTFPIPADVDLREYVLVDISQEPADGDPTHSGDSIVRGELDFA
jgi:hypothetical protein